LAGRADVTRGYECRDSPGRDEIIYVEAARRMYDVRMTDATTRVGGTAERITVNLTEKTSDALAATVELTRDSKTDTINKALQMYAFFWRVVENGGAIYIREGAAGELERLRPL
jgi:hypothetical protein